MTKGQQLAGVIVGLALIAVYSWIMIDTSGNASWAWIILLGAVALLVWTARSAAVDRSGGSGPSDSA